MVVYKNNPVINGVEIFFEYPASFSPYWKQLGLFIALVLIFWTQLLIQIFFHFIASDLAK